MKKVTNSSLLSARTPQEPWRFTETTSPSPAEPIPRSPFPNQKREL
ncbi:rRNA promoter binding protein [Loa loa]|uniref:rRNA promoter binding protein n=1 Tax=Loa loa TaxID=7209 RepID=A0A1S0TE55_LOALO|nr:rRNA promoter binding protein [Loa loa]EFO12203.1 rRNA promoter binding protein [Loa loa]